jgi:hypothetical protein
VGMRASISPGDRRGVVGYVGLVEGLAGGFWVGVRLDEPLGKNAGSVGGKAYFEAPDKHGSFIRPCLVSVGEHLRPLWEEEMGELEPEAAAAGGGEGGGHAAHSHAGGCCAAAPAEAAAAAAGEAPPAAAKKAAPKPKRRGQLDDDGDDDEDDSEL